LLLTYILSALDIRALQAEFSVGLRKIVEEELAAAFGTSLSVSQIAPLAREIHGVMTATLDKTSTMDAVDRMNAVTASTSSTFIDFFGRAEFTSTAFSVSSISQFRSKVASRGVELLQGLRKSFLTGERGDAPASPYLNKTRPIYEFVRLTLGVRIHGYENHSNFANGLGVDNESIGQNISRIYEVSFLCPFCGKVLIFL
jgi:phenylalanine ammonia-lyase